MDARSPDVRVSVSSQASPSAFDFERQIALLRRWSGLFALVTGAALGLSVVLLVLVPPRYQAVAEVMIDARQDRVVDLNPVLPNLSADASVVDTEVEVLKSRALAEKAASSLALDRDPWFDPALRPSLWDGLIQTLSGRPAARGPAAAATRLMARLKIARVGFTSVIGISARSRSPDEAARIANAVVALYLRQQLDAKTLAARRASDWLSARLGGLRNEVEAAEHEVERYKTAHGLMTLTDSQGATITEQEISNLDVQLSTARGERAEAEARLAAAERQIAGGGQGDDVGEVLNSPVVQELRKQRDAAAKTIAEFQGRYGPRHPELLKAERQRTELDAQIQQEIARVVSNLRVQAEVARGRSAAVASALASAKGALAHNNGASVELKELERNLESERTLYQSFLDRFKQTSAQDGLAQSDARVVSLAQPPTAPEFPRPLVWMAVTLPGALALGLLAIWIAEAREDGIYGAEDVERRLSLPCLGLAPTVARRTGGEPAAPIAVLLEEPLSGFAEAFRALRAGLFAVRGGGAIRIVAITSALPEEGKTTTCLCLARTVARTGAEVVVVDCDLRRRTLNRLMAAPPRVGLLEVLSGAATLEEALVVEDGLSLLPLGDEQAMAEGVLESPAMDRLLETLRGRFKVVVLDTAPVLIVTETRALAAKADAVLFLARWRRTPAETAAAAVRILNDAGAHVAGAALTQVDPRSLGRRDYAYGALDYPFYRQDADAGRNPPGRRRLMRPSS